MSYGQSLGLTLPTVSSTVGPTYATQINAALQALIDVLEAKVTPAGIDISSDLSMKSGTVYSAITNASKVNFQDKTSSFSATTNPECIYVKNDELWFNDGNANAVQLTASGSPNFSTSSGTFTPTLTVGGTEITSLSPAWTYSSRSGLYVKVGPLVFVHFDIDFTAGGAATAQTVTISGHPASIQGVGTGLEMTGNIGECSFNPADTFNASQVSDMWCVYSGSNENIALQNARYWSNTGTATNVSSTFDHASGAGALKGSVVYYLNG